MTEKNRLIVKHNGLIEARYTLSAPEAKIIALVASMVQKDDKDFCTYTFQAADLLKMLGMGEKNHARLRSTLKRLMRRVISIETLRSDLDVHFMSSAEYLPSGRVELSFDPKLKPYFLQLHNGNYTKYLIEDVLRLSSGYSFRIYELCKQYLDIGKRTIEVKHLREILELPKGIYPRFTNFDTRILQFSQKEINEKTNLIITYTKNRKDRRVHSITFFIAEKKGAKPEVKRVRAPKSSRAKSQSDLEALKRAEDDARYERHIKPLKKAFSELSEAERAPFEAQTSLWDSTGDAKVIAWAKSEGLWEEETP